MKKLVPLILCLAFVFTACSKQAEENTTSRVQTTQTSVSSSSNMFSDRDYDDSYDENNCVLIKLNGDTVQCSDASVTIDGSTVTVTQEKDYLVTGTLNDGMIIVDAPDTAKPRIILKDADITSKTSAPVYVRSADKLFITLAAGSSNSLSNSGEFKSIDENNIDSVIFSKEDLTVNGAGSLKISSPSGKGIVSKDDLVLTGGVITADCSSHILDANDSVRLDGVKLGGTAGKDVIHCENSDDTSLGFVYSKGCDITADAQSNGISAGAYILLDGGSFNFVCGGGSENGEDKSQNQGFGGRGDRNAPPNQQATVQESSETDDDSSVDTKAVKAEGDITLNNCTITADSADDCIHSNGTVTVSGATLNLSSGDDAVHSDESLTINDGNINVSTSYEGLESLAIEIKGGELSINATDDGINSAGGKDESGFESMGNGGEQFGRRGEPGGIKNGESAGSDGSIIISGGSIYVQAGGDGIDSNGSLKITGGSITVCGPNQGDTSILDYDTEGIITGGTFIGTGGKSMAVSFSNSEQGVVFVSLSGKSGDSVIIKDSKGNVIAQTKPALNYDAVIISAPELEKGKSYSLTAGGSTVEVKAS